MVSLSMGGQRKGGVAVASGLMEGGAPVNLLPEATASWMGFILSLVLGYVMI